MFPTSAFSAPAPGETKYSNSSTRRANRIDATGTDRLFAPVGLDVGADGPEQIAVSIVAELLAVRASSAPRHLREKDGVIHVV